MLIVGQSPMFPPDRAIAGIPRCIQGRPPEKRRKGQFSPLILQGCMQAQPRHNILIAIPRLKIATDVAANEQTIYLLSYAVFSRERFTTVTAYRGFVTKSQLLETLFTRN